MPYGGNALLYESYIKKFIFCLCTLTFILFCYLVLCIWSQVLTYKNRIVFPKAFPVLMDIWGLVQGVRRSVRL